jgi:hypothetical protein
MDSSCWPRRQAHNRGVWAVVSTFGERIKTWGAACLWGHLIYARDAVLYRPS